MTFRERREALRKARQGNAAALLALPLSVAGRLEVIHEWLVGAPVYAECPCGCGEQWFTGRREPLISKADAARLMEAM